MEYDIEKEKREAIEAGQRALSSLRTAKEKRCRNFLTPRSFASKRDSGIICPYAFPFVSAVSSHICVAFLLLVSLY